MTLDWLKVDNTALVTERVVGDDDIFGRDLRAFAQFAIDALHTRAGFL